MNLWINLTTKSPLAMNPTIPPRVWNDRPAQADALASTSRSSDITQSLHPSLYTASSGFGTAHLKN